MDRTKEETEALRVFGANIRKWRKERGLSQEGLALACDLDRTYVGGAERGERNLSLLNIMRIARSLRIAPAELLRGIRADE